jgi:hypothetical protein
MQPAVVVRAPVFENFEDAIPKPTEGGKTVPRDQSGNAAHVKKI